MMKKQFISVLILTGLFFMLGTGLTAQASEEWQTLYEAYDIDPDDPNAQSLLSEMMIENPPKEIVIKLDHFTGPSGTPIVPLEGELTVELGKSGNLSTSFSWEEDRYRLDYDVDLEVRYERDEDSESAASLFWASEAYVEGSKLVYIPEALEERWVEVYGDTYIREAEFPGLFAWDNSYIQLSPKSRSEESHKNLPLNLGTIAYNIDRVKVKSGGLSSIFNTDADTEGGETGLPVAPVIAVGVLGLAAAALGLKSKGKKSKKQRQAEDEKEEQSSFNLYVRKDFGNKIKRGGAPEFVYARMVEVKKGGVEVNRDDLTARIEIFSPDSYMEIGTPSFSGDYMGASVKADYYETGGPEEGTVSFRFTGEGGTFQNNVKFQIVGDPYINYPEKGKDLSPTINMVYGCNGKYEYKIEFCDFAKPLTNAQIEIARDDLASGKLEKVDEYNYVINLDNLSSRPDTSTYKTESFNIKITGENESEYVEDRVRVVLQPEGLSVVDMDNQFDDEGYFKVICYPDADKVDSGEVLPTRFKLQLTVAETKDDGKTEVKVISPSDYTPVFGELKGTDTKTDTLASRYPIEVNAAEVSNRGIYRFEPKQSLPEPETGRIHIKLPISADYGNEKYEIELNVRLMGEPMDPMAGWDEELEILRKRVERYGLSADLAERMRALGRNRSTQELRLMNKMILIESSIYFTNEAREYNDIADRLQEIETGLEVIKWLGDQSFSVLMTIYTGPAGEAIITPAKEILVAMIGEVGTQIFMGETFVFENLKVADNISAVFESYILNSLGPDMSMKKAGVVIAGFAIFNFSKHYLLDVDERGNRDFYKALNSAFSDLTSTTMKIAAGKYFENLVGSKKSGEKLQGWVSNWLKEGLPEMVYDEAGEKILSKYLEEICGKGAAWVYGTMNEASENGELNVDVDKLILTVPLEFDNTGIKVPVYVGVDLTRITESLFDYIYDKMFSPLPLPKEKASISQDPTYTPSA